MGFSLWVTQHDARLCWIAVSLVFLLCAWRAVQGGKKSLSTIAAAWGFFAGSVYLLGESRIETFNRTLLDIQRLAPATVLIVLISCVVGWLAYRRADFTRGIRVALFAVSLGLVCLVTLSTSKYAITPAGESFFSLPTDRSSLLYDFAPNILLYMPLGLSATLAIRLPVVRLGAYLICLSLLIELLQASFGRATQLQDILANGLGSVLGLIAGVLLDKNPVRRDRDVQIRASVS